MNKLSVVLLMLLFSIVVLSSSAIIASADELAFKNIDAFVDGQKFSNLEQDTSDLEVRPGEQLRLVVELENLYDEQDNIEIDSIELTLTINDIRRNGDDLYYEFRDFGIDAGEEKEKEAVFDIPTDALTGDYILEIKAEGYDDNKNEQEEIFTFPLRLRKRTHDILASEPVFDRSEAACGDTVTLSISLENKGIVVEDVKITATNSKLGIVKKQEATISPGDLDQGNKMQKDIIIFIPENAKEGSYEFDVLVEYFDKTIEKSAMLSVVCAQGEAASPGKIVENVNVIGKGVVDVPQEEGTISRIFKAQSKEIAIFSGLGVLLLVVVFVIIGMLIRR